jgi:fucose permease
MDCSCSDCSSWVPGSPILQTASNPYITILGPRESAAKRISIMGICNKTAGGLAPFIMGAVILNNADAMMVELGKMDAAAKAVRLDELRGKVILPYSVMAVIIIHTRVSNKIFTTA